MTLRVVPEGLASASAAVESITARLAAAHAGAAPAITAVVPGVPRVRRNTIPSVGSRSVK